MLSAEEVPAKRGSFRHLVAFWYLPKGRLQVYRCKRHLLKGLFMPTNVATTACEVGVSSLGFAAYV